MGIQNGILVNVMSMVGNDTSVEHEIYLMLKKTFILLDDCERQFFAEYGLSTRQFWVLRHLSERQKCSMVDLSRVLFTDKSNVTGIVDRLEHLNLVTRTPNSYDRRVILVALTPEGHCLRNAVKEEHDLRICDLMSVANGTNLQSLLDYLYAISRNIETHLGHVNNTQVS